VTRNASVKGTDRKILRFTVETRDGHDDSESKERLNTVPCVLFNPTPELEQTLTSQGVLDLEGSEQTYVANAHVQRILQKLVDDKAAILKDGAPSSYQGVLCTLNCRLMTQITPQVRRHMLPLRKDDIEDLD
jgi:hypothetical protein